MSGTSLKNILLRRLDRLLNPDFRKSFVRSLVAAGAGCLGYGGLSKSLVEVWIPIPWGQVAISFGNDNAVLFVAIGLFLILVALWAYVYTVPQTPAKTEYPRRSTARKLLVGLAADMTNSKFTLEEKRLIFINKHREISKHLPADELIQLNGFAVPEPLAEIEMRFQSYADAAFALVEDKTQ